MDMLLPPQGKNKQGLPLDPPKLDIKKDPKGMVTVTGATVVQVCHGHTYTNTNALSTLSKHNRAGTCGSVCELSIAPTLGVHAVGSTPLLAHRACNTPVCLKTHKSPTTAFIMRRIDLYCV